MERNIPAIYTWGKKIQEDFNLSAIRRKFTYPFEMTSNTPRETIIDFISSQTHQLGISEFNASQGPEREKSISKKKGNK